MSDTLPFAPVISPDDVFGEIIENMREYHPSDDFRIVHKAFSVATEAHKGQFRASGEPYVLHPLEVALILTTIEMDRDTIAAAILHDVIEDTRHTFEDIEGMFGEEIAMLVEGVTKLEQVNYDGPDREPWQREADMQADNYRKMFLAMSHDIRVVLIKIADRLHNLRTIKHMSDDHKKRKADETLDIYAPLANRLGIAKLRYELEDLAFRYQNPAAYEDLKLRIQRKQGERRDYIKKLVNSIAENLGHHGVKAEVTGRPKHFFSIYRKMKQKDKELDQIYDLFAVRIIVDRVEDCYMVLGHIHAMYNPMPERFKDYISSPKPNMYQSIHNTLIGPEGEPFEIQIRTGDMHKTSEYGIAAHWIYKGKGNSYEIDNEKKLDWLRQILDWQRDLSESSEFLDELKQDLDLYKDRIFCFTPKGRSIELIRGSTPIDFAYAVHSAVGNRMVGALVNEKIAPLNTVLSMSDRVEILTSQNSKGPSRDWLKICKTSQARAKINAWFKKQNREENIARGKSLLEEGAKRKGVPLDELMTKKAVAAALNRFSLNDWDSLLAVVGHGGLTEGQVVNRLYSEYLRERGADTPSEESIIQLINEKEARKPKDAGGVSFRGGDNNMSYRLSFCCNPMPGDEIVGFITRGRGISVHRSDCVNIMNMDELGRHRLVFVEWSLADEDNKAFHASLDMIASNQTGVIADVTRLMADERINLDSFNTYRAKNNTLLRITFNIAGRAQLDKLITKLATIDGVFEVKRTIT